MYNHILIPTDGSPLSTVAVEKGLAFARDAGAKVTVLTVVMPFHVISGRSDQLSSTPAEYEQQSQEAASAYLSEAEMKARSLGVPCEAVLARHDQPYRAIIDTAKDKGCDLIAMASHGRRGVSAIVLGSETVKVLTHSTIPVLVYR
ncbi:universal stress protein [Mesorhizobium sp. KR2-14]|uniref:universal stress protein n=1 Tax=Mesorhizobium sp. KR2-14 TaxID=3156610 RepID=UPI0032B31AD7